ncbi:hypothetical protein ABPG72_013950 [Tetrahymena utriculariae]
MNASQISEEYEKIMKQITHLRIKLFDCVEIPHLINYYDGGDQVFCIQSDLYLVRQAETYITKNLCAQYSADISRQVNQCINELYRVRKQFDNLNQIILKQHLMNKDLNVFKSCCDENMQNTIIIQNSVIEEYFNLKLQISSY